MRPFFVRKSQRTTSLFTNYLILSLLLVYSLGPLLVMVFNSVKTTFQISDNPIGFPLDGIRWQNYIDAWVNGNYSTTVRNSAMIVAMTIVGVLVISGLAAYSLARLRPRGSDLITIGLLVGSSLPIQMFLVPLYFLWSRLGLLNNLLGVAIIYWALYSPFSTFLLRSFMITVPEDFIDAARIDGASEWQVFGRIMVPICWPGFLTTGLVTGLWAWNEFLIAITFLQKTEVKTVSISIYSFTTTIFSRDWGLMSAASIIMVLPVIFIFLLLQRQFISGLTQGGLKG